MDPEQLSHRHYNSLAISTQESDLSDAPSTSRGHSTVIGASLNLTNSIIGAGCIGYGGAIAQSGGLASIVTVAIFAILSKISLDICVALAVETDVGQSSYEALGTTAFGRPGRLAVMISKFLLAYGCLVAYIVIVKDNFAPACRHLLGADEDTNHHGLTLLLFDENLSAFFLSVIVILPLCLLRDMTPLERFSAIKIATILFIVLITFYLWLTIPDDDKPEPSEESNFVTHWLVIRPGIIQSMGTFVLTFVGHHTVHMVYHSLRSEHRNLHEWSKVSTLSILLSAFITLSLGLFIYMTYWEDASSNMFQLYPPSSVLDLAQIGLCIMMLCTFPMPFFACRELIIIALPQPEHPEETEFEREIERLVPKVSKRDPRWWLMPGEELQLIYSYHILLTVGLWGVTVILALVAPSLGDVLDLVGCVTGTTVCFILPGLFSLRIKGYSHIAALLLALGVIVGVMGTYFSLVQLIKDFRY